MVELNPANALVGTVGTAVVSIGAAFVPALVEYFKKPSFKFKGYGFSIEATGWTATPIVSGVGEAIPILAVGVVIVTIIWACHKFIPCERQAIPDLDEVTEL